MYTLTTRVYLDPYCQQYRNIIMINQIPEGPLRAFVRRIRLPPLMVKTMDSPFFEDSRGGCGLALLSFLPGHHYGPWMSPNEIPDLFSFLYSNGYHIDTSVTKMMNTSSIRLDNRNILCFFSYMKKEKG